MHLHHRERAESLWMSMRVGICYALLSLAGFGQLARAVAQEVEWLKQFDIGRLDFPEGVTADPMDNAYVAGGTVMTDDEDGFLRKFDSAGNVRWSRELATSARDSLSAIHYSANNRILVAGLTEGDLFGVNAGSSDAVLASYGTDGGLLWTRQVGTPGLEFGLDVAADPGGNAFLVGQTGGDLYGKIAGLSDAFVSKYDAVGNLLWGRQFGSAGIEFASSVATDLLGNLFVSGWIDDDPTFGTRSFLRRYDGDGTLIWSEEFGPIDELTMTYDVATDSSGNVYATGFATLFAGTFIRKYDAHGSLLWEQILGGPGDDHPQIGLGIATNDVGAVFVSGQVEQEDDESFDAFVAAFSPNGEVLWDQRFGGVLDDRASGVATVGFGTVYVTGYVSNDIGDVDGFLARVQSIPEPRVASLLAFGLTLLISMVRQQKNAAVAAREAERRKD